MQTSMKQTDLEEVRMVILSLLVARPGWTPITLLDNDYYEAEYKRIPWRPLGFSSLLEFLQSMPNCFEFTYLNGVNCVRGIADKSKHVSSLVSRQKRMPRYNSTRPYRSYYQPHVLRSRPKIPAENLNNMVQYVKQNPNGVNIGDVLLMIQNQLPYVTLTTRDIQEQLRDLGHQLYLDGDTIRPAMRNGSAFRARTSGCYVPPPAASKLVNTSVPSTSNVVYTVPEECSDILNDEDGFVRPNSAHRSSQPRTDERLASSLKECQNREEMINYYDYGGNQEEKYDNSVCSIDIDIDLATENESNKLSDLISQRMQSRLQQLIQKYPNGIKCSELADLYMQEFKMPLNYIELGFNSAGHFASLLPDIFYVTRPDTTGDFILYNADKKPIEQDVAGNDDQRISNSSAQNTKSQTNPIDIPNTRLEQDDTDSNDASFPLNLSPEVLHRFAPKDVALCDDINYILVTDLQKDKKKYLEVYIVEVFTPSFFWIHLRRNVKFFDSFMSSLGDFYEQHKEEYVIPKLALKRGLNCACIYNHAWHRAVIKAVKPDFRVTVMFYDYGTQKTYPPESIFYLAKQFFHLPAQAIPCGLYDVKPIIGERWKKSIIDRFIDKISEALLAATVVSVDPPNNSMMIILTDTTEKEDVRINDWLIEENLARRGKMGDSVDMASLTKYIVNIANRLPSYCFAEENPVSIDSYSKSTTTEECNELPKVSPDLNYVAYRDNNQQLRPVPPGFVPLNEHVDQFNTQTNRHYVYPTVGSIPNISTPSLFSDLTENMVSSSLLDGNFRSFMSNITSDIFSGDVERQMFAQFMQENTTLQIQLTNSFRYLLQFPPETKNTCLDYITLLFQFNNALKILVKELDKRLVNVIPNASRNNENDVGPSLKTYNYNPNCESSVNQETASSPRPQTSSSSTVNLFGEYHSQYHNAAFPTSDVKDFPYSSNQHQVHTHNPHNLQPQAQTHNFGQSANQVVSPHQADVNGPYVQSSFTTSSNPEFSVFNKHENITKDITSFLQNTSSGKTLSSTNNLRKSVTNNLLLDANSKLSVTNATFFPTSSEVLSNDAEKQTLAQSYIDQLLHKSVLNTITASHSNTTNINPSSCRQSANEFANTNLQNGNIYKNEEPTKRKETNPFILHESVEEQTLTEQNVHNNYDMTNFALYLPKTNQQSYTPTVNENTNAGAADYNFYRTYENTGRSESNVGLVSTEYRMYEDIKANSDLTASNYTPRIIYEARPVMYNLQKKPEEQQLSSQSATQSENNIVNNSVVDHVASSSSVINTPVLNDEGYVTPTIQTHNLSPMTNTEDRYQSDVNTNVLLQHALPEAWSSAMAQNNNPLPDHSKSSVSATMRPLTSLHKERNYETNKEFTTTDSYRTTESYRTSPNDDSERTMIAKCTNFCNSAFNKDQKGTILFSKSLQTSFLFKKIDSVEGVTILFHMDEDGWILIHEFMEAFTKFSKSCRLLTLLETNVSIPFKEVHRFEYPVQFLQLDSYPLNVTRDSKNRIISLNLISLQAALGLLYRLKLVSREEIENAFKGNKTFTQNSVMLNMCGLLVMYKDLRHQIKYSADYGI